VKGHTRESPLIWEATTGWGASPLPPIPWDPGYQTGRQDNLGGTAINMTT